MPSRRWVAVGIAVLLAGAGLWWARGHGSASSPPTDPPSRPIANRVEQLERSLRAVADGERDAPRDRWDPAYVAEQVGRDPDSLRAWVRANTDWIPYRGVLRGAPGVLMDRQGNSLDRAILLAALLQHAGHETRLARGGLSDELAGALLPALLTGTVREYDGSPDDSDGWALRTAAAEYGLDQESLEASLGAQVKAMDSLTQVLHARVAEQTRRLLAQVPRPAGQGDSLQHAEWAAESLRDHWWVQVEQDGTWRDLDLLDIPSPAPEEVAPPAALPDDLYHTLTVRVVAEEQKEGERGERPALAHTLRPWELGGRALALQLWPAKWPKELHSNPRSALGLRGQALAQRVWVASLGVGDSMVANGTLGAARKAEEPNGNPMGGFGRVIAAAVDKDTAVAELTAAWIEYELRAPGRPVRSWRRAVFDLLGPAARAAGTTAAVVPTEDQRLQRSLALMMRTELLPVTSALAPEFGLHLVAKNLLANTGLLRELAGTDSTAPPEGDTLAARFVPGVSPLYALALARLEWSRLRRWLYVDQVGLLARHRHLGAAGDGHTVRGSVEILARDLGVAPGGPDAFAVRLEQGVLDTNAEALWWAGEGINNTGDAFERGGEWVVLAAAEPAGVDRLALHDDARARMRQDLSAGLTLVAPREPVSRGVDHFAGWWRIDPLTGATAGTPANGWAQCGTEYSLHLAVAAEMIQAMAFEYAFCHLMAQAVNEFKRFVKSFGTLLYAGPIQVLRPSEVQQAAEGGCIKGAIVAGMFATLPFLIIQSRRYAEFGLIRPHPQPTPKPFLQQGKNNTIKIGGGGGPTGPHQPVGQAPGLAPTEPALGAGQPGLQPGQPGLAPGGPKPSGPGKPPSAQPHAPSHPAGKPGGPPGPGEPVPPKHYPPTDEGVQAAREGYQDAVKRDRDAWNELMAYRDKYPVNGRWGYQYDHPGFDPRQDDKLVDAMMKAHLERQQAGEELNQVIQARRNAPPPAPAPSPGARIGAGASGAADSFWEIPWD